MPWWTEMPWRLVQTNLREPDFQDLDPGRYAQDLADFGATVVLINAAGISASYDTKLSFHTRNPYLSDPEVLSKVVDELHYRGLKVLARTDFSKVPVKIGNMHPQWFYRSNEGKPMLYNGYAQTCINGAYQQEYALQILKDLFSCIPFDGLYCNMGGFQTYDYSHRDYGFCHCASCQEKFYSLAHAQIPVARNLEDPVYHQYLAFQQQIVSAYRTKIAQVLKPLSNQALCLDGIGFDRREAASEINQSPIDFLYHAASNSRTRQKSRILSNADVNFLGFAHRHVSVPPVLHQLRLYQTLAHGSSLDYYCMGRLDTLEDRSALGVVKKAFALHERYHHLFDHTDPVAHVLLRRNSSWVITEEEKGFITLLTESHILFTEATEEKLLTLELNSFSLIILADSWNLKDTEARLLDAYVQSGGRLLSTGRTGFFDSVEGKRKKPLLSCLGVKQLKNYESDTASALFQVKKEEKTDFFPSLTDIDILPVGDHFIIVEKEEGVKVLLCYIPPHPYGPPEICFYPSVSLQGGILVHQYGEGESMYLPWFPGSFFSRTGTYSLRLMADDLFFTWAKLTTLAVNVPSCVEVSMAKTDKGDLILHIVNSSIPLGPLVLKVPSPQKPLAVFSVQDTEITHTWEQGESTLTLAHLAAYDALILQNTKENT